jgi:catechol 2,3-dioxygenase-like lactoylglutathione lyase family enzyme
VSNPNPPTPDGVLEAALYAHDLVAAEQFYREVLGLIVIAHQPSRHVFFRCGQTLLLVFNPQETANATVSINGNTLPKHGAQGAGHVAFSVAKSALSAWRERLRKGGVSLEAEIAWPQGGHSLYVRDPAGNSVELATLSIWPQLKGASTQRMRAGQPRRLSSRAQSQGR